MTSAAVSVGAPPPGPGVASTVLDPSVAPGGLQQDMKMLRHQHPTDQAEMELGASGAPGLDKKRAAGGAGKDGCAAVSAAGDKLQLARFEVTMVKRHGGPGSSTAPSRTARAWQFDRRRPEKQGLRQPPIASKARCCILNSQILT
ncbi:MAG: hypothetical protein ACRD2O_04780 [Terriglobia bacterium]